MKRVSFTRLEVAAGVVATAQIGLAAYLGSLKGRLAE
jgi:hypothetical protein